MAEITAAGRVIPAGNAGQDRKDEADIHREVVDGAGLSEAQKTLAVAAVTQKSKNLGTFTAIKYYWVAFLWSQYCSIGALLVGYDGTVSRWEWLVPAGEKLIPN
jgi:hypothetical protein